MTFADAEATPVVFNVAHIDLCFFYDLDIVILIVEIFADDLPLTRVQDTMFRFGRAYPNYWTDDGRGGHCLAYAEWLATDGGVLARSDYEQRDESISRTSAVIARSASASHWTHLLRPLTPEHSDEKGPIRYRRSNTAGCRSSPTSRSTTHAG